MNVFYFIAIFVNLIAFFMGNYFRWQKTMKVQKPVYNTATLIATIVIGISLIAIVFLANNLIIGIITAVLMFVVVNPIVSGVLSNIFMKDKK